MADLLQIGLSGIYSSQANLTTTSHNIANINTKGYSRQTVDVSSASAHNCGNYFIGQGSVVEGIERAYDQFAFIQNLTNTSLYSYSEAVYSQNSQMDTLLSGDGSSATPSVLALFSSLGDVANSPTSLDARNVFLKSSRNMANQYNTLYDNLEFQYSNINNDISNAAKTITSLAENITNINQQICNASGAGGGSNANDLLDQRDQIITQLSELVNVSVVDNGNNMVNVYIGSGTPLVMGSEFTKIVAVSGEPDSSSKELATDINGNLSKIDSSRLGGQVSGLFEARADVERAFNQLGQNIIGLTNSINEQQKEGQTLNGQIGDDLFNDVNDRQTMRNRVLSHNDGLGSAQLSVRIDDVSQLSADDYELVVNRYTAGPPEIIEFNMTNQTTGASQILGPLDLTDTQRIDIPNSGLSLGIDAIIASDPPQAGKTFTLRPTRLAAQEVSLQEDDPSQVAAADAEIKLQPTEGNSGNARLRVSALNNPLDPLYMDAENSLQIVITGNAGGIISYEIQNQDGNAVTLPAGSSSSFVPAKAAGDLLTGLTVTPDSLSGKVTFSVAGVDVEMVSGHPVAGDRFTLNYNETGNGDNSNANKLVALQQQKIMNNGTLTFQDVYSGMVSQIGAKTANADTVMQSAKILKAQSYERMQETSGVNMDEEAGNLLQYQQYYSASARIISVATDIFDAILQASR